MYATPQAKAAYGHNNVALQSAQETEYELFASITADLMRAAQSPSDFPKLANALHKNERLWTILAKDVSDPNNALPAQTRAQIFYLFEFTVHHSSLVRNGQADISALVEINRSIMRGLSSVEGNAA